MSMFRQPQTQVPTKYNGMRVTQALLGQPIPLIFGQHRVAGKLLWYGDFVAAKAKTPGGSGGGFKKGGSQYVYTSALIALLCQGPSAGLQSVWDGSGKFVILPTTESTTVASGSPYSPVNLGQFNTDQGVAFAASYAVGTNDFGAPGPVTLSGVQNVPVPFVAGGSPGAGQYSINGSGQYVFNSADNGKTALVSYSFYRYFIDESELSIVPFVSPYTVTVEHQPNFQNDLGVVYFPSGIPFTKVSGTPTLAGTYNPNGGNYKFAPADAGQGIEISYEWQNVNTDNNAPNSLNLTFVPGAKGQSPWSYLTSKHPGQALGYTQLCYVASSALYLGYTPELPAYNYEVAGLKQFGAGIVDACPSDCIQGILDDPGYGVSFPSQYIHSSLQGIARNFWVANSFFISDIVEGNENAAEVIGKWLEAGQVGAFWSEGVLKFVPYGTSSAIANGAQYTPPTTPILAFNDGNYTPRKGADPIKVSRSSWQDAWNRVNIKWSVRINDYNDDVTPEQDDASIARYGLRPEAAQTYNFITTLAAAQFAANMRLQRNVAIRNTQEFGVNHSFPYLEPGDIIELNDTALGLNATAVRITKTEDDPKTGIAITSEDFPWASGSPTLYPKQPSPTPAPFPGQEDPGNTNLLVVELPARAGLQQSNTLFLFAAGEDSNWGGCSFYQAVGTDSCAITQVKVLSNVLTITGANTLKVGEVATFFDVATATFLNGESVTVVSASGTQFTAAFTHANYGPTADSGAAWSMTPFSPWTGTLAGNSTGAISGGSASAGGLGAVARTGLIAASFPLHASLDLADTLTVDMTSPAVQLESISAAAAASPFPTTLSALIHLNAGAAATIELISYQNAALSSGSTQAGSRYLITDIERGLFGTSPAAFNVADIFVRLDDATVSYQYDPTLIGETIFIKAPSFNLLGNQQQSLADVVPLLVALEGTVGAFDTNTGAPSTSNWLPTFSGSLTYAATTTTITWSWTGVTIFLGDGTSVVVPDGSQVVTGLLANTTYYFYPVWNKALGQLQFIDVADLVMPFPNITGVDGDGTTGYVSTTTSLTRPTTYTVEFWFLQNTNVAGVIVEFNENQTNPANAVFGPSVFMTSANGGTLNYYTKSATTVSGTASNLNNGEWHHVVMTYNGTTVTAYVDGVLDVTGASAAPTSFTGWWRMFSGEVTGNFFGGTLSHVAIYSGVALTAAQVQVDYQLMLNSGMSQYEAQVLANGATYFWKLLDTGSSYADSASSNTGTGHGTLTDSSTQAVISGLGSPGIAWYTTLAQLAQAQQLPGFIPLSPGGMQGITPASGTGGGSGGGSGGSGRGVCVSPSTKVRGGIEFGSLKVGDEVRNAKGETKKITEIIRHHYVGPMMKLPDGGLITPYHTLAYGDGPIKWTPSKLVLRDGWEPYDGEVLNCSVEAEDFDGHSYQLDSGYFAHNFVIGK